MQRDILQRKPSGALLDRFFAYLPYLHFLRSPIVTGLLLLGFPWPRHICIGRVSTQQSFCVLKLSKSGMCWYKMQRSR